MLKQELYTYNEQGLRIKKEEFLGSNRKSTYYVYSGNDILFTETYVNDTPIDLRFNLSDMASYTYHYGEDPQEELNYYYKDHKQNRVIKTEADGSIASGANKFGYSSWGELDNEEATEESWFTGKKQDESSLYYFNARYYDPRIGRFLQEDPDRNGLNWYAYCDNNPVNMFDPDGKQYVDGTSALQIGEAAGSAGAAAKIIQFTAGTGSKFGGWVGLAVGVVSGIVIYDIASGNAGERALEESEQNIAMGKMFWDAIDKLLKPKKKEEEEKKERIFYISKGIDSNLRQLFVEGFEIRQRTFVTISGTPYDGRGYDAATSKPVGATGGWLRTKKDPTRGIVTAPIGEELLEEFKKSGWLIEDGNGWSAAGPVLEYMNITMMVRETSSEKEGLLSEIAPVPENTPRCATKYFRDETKKYHGLIE